MFFWREEKKEALLFVLKKKVAVNVEVHSSHHAFVVAATSESGNKFNLE